MGPRWIVAAALQRELKGLLGTLKGRVAIPVSRGALWSGWLEGVPVLLARTGMGGTRARGVCEGLLRSSSCEGILSIGYAGSLKTGMSVGDVLIAEEIMLLTRSGTKAFFTDNDLRESAKEIITHTGSRRVFTGRMISTNRVIASAQEKEKLGAQFGALGVEMESAALAELAQEFSVPFLVIRTVSDGVSTTLPDYDRIRELRVHRRYPQLLLYMMRNPRDLVGVLQMHRFADAATKELTRSVIAFFRRLKQPWIQGGVKGGA